MFESPHVSSDFPSFLCFCLSSSCFTEDSQKGERCHVLFLWPLISFTLLLLLLSIFHDLLIYTVWYLLSLPLLLSLFTFTSPSFSPMLLDPFIFLLPLLSVCMSVLLFNAAVPPCCPLRCFPNFWSLSGAAWPCPPLSFLHSHQERRWDSELCPPSTTTTRLNNFWI